MEENDKHTCAYCGKPLTIKKNGKFATYCSSGCASKATREKAAKTSIDRYGKVGYNNREKAAKTCKEKYGDEYGKIISERTTIALKEKYGDDYAKQITSKSHKTLQEKYGGGPLAAPGAMKKRNETMQEKYGESNYYNIKKAKETRNAKYGGYVSPEIISKIKQTMMERYGVTSLMQHEEFQQKIVNSRRKIGDCESHTKLLPVNYQEPKGNIIICQWLDEWGIEYETSNRTAIAPQELDIYIPSKKIAIEFNGCFWHSTKFKNPKYHQKKFELCQDNSIQLIQIWEDWFRNKEDIVKSFLQAKLGICSKTIYARKCSIVEVTGSISNEFYNENHIQGQCRSKINLALEFEGKIVACMSFSKRSKLSGSKQVTDGEWELIRFCNKKDIRVIGAAGKLMNEFIRKIDPTIITSYSANDISNGGLYKTLGFEQYGPINSSYWYVRDVTFQRYHRSTFSKAGIVRHGWKDKIDNSWTEREVMESLPFFRIYDSGTTCWRWYKND